MALQSSEKYGGGQGGGYVCTCGGSGGRRGRSRRLGRVFQNAVLEEDSSLCCGSHFVCGGDRVYPVRAKRVGGSNTHGHRRGQGIAWLAEEDRCSIGWAEIEMYYGWTKGPNRSMRAVWHTAVRGPEERERERAPGGGGRRDSGWSRGANTEESSANLLKHNLPRRTKPVSRKQGWYVYAFSESVFRYLISLHSPLLIRHGQHPHLFHHRDQTRQNRRVPPIPRQHVRPPAT